MYSRWASGQVLRRSLAADFGAGLYRLGGLRGTARDGLRPASLSLTRDRRKRSMRTPLSRCRERGRSGRGQLELVALGPLGPLGSIYLDLGPLGSG